MLSDTYLTIAQPSEGMIREKGSRFLSFAFPVSNEDEIKTLVASIRKEHYSARHCCFAWCLGPERERFRINDDGEPSGTAGRPIYGQLVSKNLTNILLVVVRYFGGTLLGVSGLIQAYKQSAIEALDNAQIVTRIVENILDIDFEYAAMNDLMLLIKEEHLEIVNSQFDLQCRITLKVRSSIQNEIENKFGKIDGVLTVGNRNH